MPRITMLPKRALFPTAAALDNTPLLNQSTLVLATGAFAARPASGSRC